jgi:hypothetical protein
MNGEFFHVIIVESADSLGKFLEEETFLVLPFIFRIGIALAFLGDSSELLLDSFLDFLLSKGSQLLLGGAVGLVGLANPSLVGEALLLLGRVALLVGKSAAFFSVVTEVGPMFLAEMGWLLLAIGLVVVLLAVVGGRTLLLCNRQECSLAASMFSSQRLQEFVCPKDQILGDPFRLART